MYISKSAEVRSHQAFQADVSLQSAPRAILVGAA